jgi:hypothetical protein
MDDQMVLFHYCFGVAYEKLGDKKKAAAFFLYKVIAVDEGFLDAKELLAELDHTADGQ